MPEPTTILVVDDDTEVRDMLDEYLTKQGFVVCTAPGGEAMRQLVFERKVDLILLDIRMPGEDGLSLTRYAREHSQAGLIMVTAASESVDCIIGLEMGADDYVTKPFNPRELVARIKSVLRRIGPASPKTPDATPSPQCIRFGQRLLDLEAHRLLTLAGEETPITAMEFDLLQVFAIHPHRLLSRDQLLEMAHSRDWEPFDRSIDIRICRLRRKIEADPTRPQTIKTIRGAGYMFMPCT